MKHNTYWTFGELKQGDKFRFAGYDDLLRKEDESHAVCLGAFGKGKKLTRKGEQVEISPGEYGCILAIW